MLLKLSVQNYALIRELDIEFGKGLTIITGETGAGKSILLGALSLILGSRADSAALLNKEEKCIVEGTFNIEGYGIEAFFDDNELDYSNTTIIRREINTAGKSRAFINDTPVNLPALKEIGDRLIDIHSQHQNLLLNSGSFQLGVIDSFAGQTARVIQYRKRFDSYRKLGQEYASLLGSVEKNRADLEYYSHQLNQIEESKFIDGEQEELEKEREMLEHAEEIKESLVGSVSILYDELAGLIVQLKELRTRLNKAGVYLQPVKELAERADSVYIEMSDLAEEVSRLEGITEADPGRMLMVTERLDLLYSLLQKHRTNNLGELLGKAKEIRERIEQIEVSDSRLDDLGKELEKEKNYISTEAAALSETRAKSVAAIEKRISDMLSLSGNA